MTQEFDELSKIRELATELLTRPEAASGAGAIIKWWEFRRVPYNVIVGIAGLLTCAIAVVTSIVAESLLGVPIGMPDPPIFAIIFAFVYACIANACFTFGWVVEILLTKLLRKNLATYAAASLAVGTVFSIVLTLLPGLLCVVALVITYLARSP